MADSGSLKSQVPLLGVWVLIGNHDELARSEHTSTTNVVPGAQER